MIKSSFEITNNGFDEVVVGKARIMHVEISLLNGIRNFRTRESEVLQSASKATIKSSIREMVTGSRKFGASVNRSATGIKIGYASLV
jgi:hypothetical protein